MRMEYSERMTIRRAADMLGVSVDTLRRWDREGRLRPAGRTISGWRYYLFTDLKTILDDLAFHHQKSLMQKTATAMARETVHALSAAHHIPLRTRAAPTDIPPGNEPRKTSLMGKAQRLLDAVNDEDYAMVIDILTDISGDLKQTEK